MRLHNNFSIRHLTCLFGAVIISACATTQTRHPDFGQDCEALTSTEAEQAVDCVRVFYGTNRAVTANVAVPANGERDSVSVGSDDAGQLALGRADIWLPKLVEQGGTREIGDTPLLKGKYPEDKEDLHTYVFITRITKNGRESFIEKLGNDMAVRGNDAVLLFVHGFNVSFENALIRSAQLTVDLEQGNMRAPGSPVLFSWPSAGKMSLGQYKKDGKKAVAAAPYLEEFLDILTTDLDITKINIIAHSMGNRVLISALETYAADYLMAHPDQDIEFRIVLAAADVERDIFDQVAGKLDSLKPNVVIYTSDDDLALQVSKLVNGKPRLGDTDKNKPYIRSVNGYETIDATPVASELFGLGHGYYSSNPFILGDIRCALAAQPPFERALQSRKYNDQDNGLEFFQTDAAIEAGFEDCDLTRNMVPNDEGSRRFFEHTGSGQGGVTRPAQSVIVAPRVVLIPAPEPEPVPQSGIAPSQEQFVLYFETGASVLTAKQKDQIERFIGNRSVQFASVQGFTDSAGSAEVNLRLSQSRAQNVAHMLAVYGMSRDYIEVNALGETEPMIMTQDGVNEALNRRVVITLIFGVDY